MWPAGSSRSSGRNDVSIESLPLTLTCRLNTTVIEGTRGKAWPRSVAASAGPRLIWLRIFSSTAVVLCVVNTLAATTAFGFTPPAAKASSSALR